MVLIHMPCWAPPVFEAGLGTCRGHCPLSWRMPGAIEAHALLTGTLRFQGGDGTLPASASKMVPVERFELPTTAMSTRCSSTELHRIKVGASYGN